MKPIEGIDLKALAESCRQELLQEQKQKVSAQVRGIIAELNADQSKRKTLENQLKQLDQSIQAKQGKLEKINGGDWEVLKDGEKGQENKNQDCRPGVTLET